ncbi:hypothetical protein ACFQH3_13320 [Haladaptatus sp. GCM10025707]|uniref:DUF7093 family protein n=1 Tax=unclassified Haladaptatus TaxID=2622732 RepID=UPI0023E7B9DF|nr:MULTISPECIES: hypothetical protein [unclassified Haladaptatus]
MSLKCSLLGHRYGELEVEREREERGSEVVVTVREIEVCERCGGTQVRSEAKEITSAESPAGEPEPVPDEPDVIVTDDLADEDAAEDGFDHEDASAFDHEDETNASEADAVEPPADPSEEDVEIIDDHEDAGVGHDTSPDLEDIETESTFDELDAETDDGVILTDEPDEPEREPGAWPDEPAREDPKDTSWIQNGADEADEPEVEETTDAGAIAPGEGVFQCPKCGFDTPVRESPLREGDICPSCKQGYLDRVATRKE